MRTYIKTTFESAKYFVNKNFIPYYSDVKAIERLLKISRNSETYYFCTFLKKSPLNIHQDSKIEIKMQKCGTTTYMF